MSLLNLFFADLKSCGSSLLDCVFYNLSIHLSMTLSSPSSLSIPPLHHIPGFNEVVDGGVHLFLLDQAVPPVLLQFHHLGREGEASQLHRYREHGRDTSFDSCKETQILFVEVKRQDAELLIYLSWRRLLCSSTPTLSGCSRSSQTRLRPLEDRRRIQSLPLIQISGTLNNNSRWKGEESSGQLLDFLNMLCWNP